MSADPLAVFPVLIVMYPSADPVIEHDSDGQVKVSPLLLGIATDDHVADPLATLIVSPLDAFVMQVLTLAWSMVAVQVGLAPVQAAFANGADMKNRQKGAATKTKSALHAA